MSNPSDDGWLITDNGASITAEWWDGDDSPKLTIRLPHGVVLTPLMKDLIEEAYEIGATRGEQRGRIYQQHDIRAALGVNT